MSNGKTSWITNYPKHETGVILAHILILITGLIVSGHLFLSHTLPNGYAVWFGFLFGMAGVNAATTGIMRSTDYEALRIKSQTAVSPITTTGPTMNVGQSSE